MSTLGSRLEQRISKHYPASAESSFLQNGKFYTLIAMCPVWIDHGRFHAAGRRSKAAPQPPSTQHPEHPKWPLPIPHPEPVHPPTAIFLTLVCASGWGSCLHDLPIWLLEALWLQFDDSPVCPRACIMQQLRHVAIVPPNIIAPSRRNSFVLESARTRQSTNNAENYLCIDNPAPVICDHAVL